MIEIDKVPKINNFIHQLFYKNKKIFNFFSNIETNTFNKFKSHTIEKPIYVCGLARSGTTLLTHLLNYFKNLGSAQYKDMPFINTPLFWNSVSNLYYGKKKDFKRFHGDSMNINLNSPDSFEEIYWLNKDHNFEITYKNFIKKILILRRSNRYLAKNNNLISRIDELEKLFVNPKIIVIYRDPIKTVESLTKVNKKIYESNDKKKISKYLKYIGHNEFGLYKNFQNPNKNNVYIENARLLWNNNKYYDAYMLEWIQISEYILNNLINNKNIFILNYDDLINNFKNKFVDILNFTEVNHEKNDLHLLEKNVKPKNTDKIYNSFNYEYKIYSKLNDIKN